MNKEFLNEPFLDSIRQNKRWTISDCNKRPIDLVAIITKGVIKGAKYCGEQSLLSLDDAISHILQWICSDRNPNPTVENISNIAYYLNSDIDNLLVLDIEPSCPDDLKNKLLDTDFIYGEKSLSGKGYHLIFELPSWYHTMPNLQHKTALKGENKYYEILLQQYVTFTGNKINKPKNPQTDFYEIFKNLAKKAEETNSKNIKIKKEQNLDDIPKAQEIAESLMTITFSKDMDIYDNDMSRFEFAYGVKLSASLNRLLKSTKYRNLNYTDDEKITIIYAVLVECLPHRDKHNTKRNGLPWLLYLAQNVYNKTQERN